MDAIEEEILDERLENWSRWAAEKKPQGTSSLLGIMREAGYVPEYGMKERPRIINIKDALEIEGAWRSMPNGPEKRILQLAYGDPSMPVWLMCRKSGFHPRKYEFFMKMAKSHLHSILARATIQ